MKIAYTIYKIHITALNIRQELTEKNSISLKFFAKLASGKIKLNSHQDYIALRRELFCCGYLDYGDIIMIDEQYYLRNYDKWDVVNVVDAGSSPSHFQRFRIQREIKRDLLRFLTRE